MPVALEGHRRVGHPSSIEAVARRFRSPRIRLSLGILPFTASLLGLARPPYSNRHTLCDLRAACLWP